MSVCVLSVHQKILDKFKPPSHTFKRVAIVSLHCANKTHTVNRVCHEHGCLDTQVQIAAAYVFASYD